MRILTVTHFYDGHGGGIERVAARLDDEFRRAGVETRWAASDSDRPTSEHSDVVPLSCINPIERLTGLPMPIPSPGAVFTLARAIRHSDAVVIHDALYVTSIAAMLLAKIYRRPVLLIQHIAGIPFASAVARACMSLANRLVTRPMLRFADHRIFISDVVRREMMGAKPRKSFTLVHNGVDTAIFHPGTEQDREATRATLGLSLDRPLVLFAGRFVAKKGLSIIEATARARPDLEFALAGDGVISPDAWQLPNVHVLGALPADRLAALYRASDLFLIPSAGEGYPLVVQEALASGLPVVCGEDSASADPGAKKWLAGVRIDLSDPAGSSSRCQKEIERILTEPIDRRTMADYAKTRYSWRSMANTILEMLAVD